MANFIKSFDNYSSWNLWLNKDSKKIGHNTYVERIDSSCIGIKYHNTYIVKYYEDGRVVLNTNGWETTTTKQRINAFIKHSVYQHKFQWFVSDKYGDVKYQDGFTFNNFSLDSLESQLNVSQAKRKLAA